MFSLYALGLCGLVYVVYQLAVTALTCPIRSLPGPWYSQFTHLVLKYHIITGRRMYYVHALHDTYGPLVRIAPREVAVADVHAAQTIHKIGSGFTKSAWYEVLVTATEGSDQNSVGIFAMRDPKVHAARRKLFARPFSSSSLQVWDDVVREKVALAVNSIHRECEREGQADVLKWWTLMTTDVIAHLSFGESFGSLEQGKQTPYIDAVQATLMAGVLFSEIPPLLRLGPYLPIKSLQRIFEAEGIVVEHGKLAYRNMRNAAANTQNLFGQMLAQADSNEKANLNEATVKREASNLVVAGSDTTAITLTYLTWAVLKRPELKRALELEVQSMSDGLTADELRDAPLLNSVIEESLRLYGAAPGALPRDVPPKGTVLCGTPIPAGVVVTTQAFSLHRDPKIFSNPLEFDGWRFVKQPMTTEQKAAYMPFGAGTRVCLGMHLAMTELRLAAAMFFRQSHGVTLSPETTDERMKMTEHFLVAPISHCCNIVAS